MATLLQDNRKFRNFNLYLVFVPSLLSPLYTPLLPFPSSLYTPVSPLLVFPFSLQSQNWLNLKKKKFLALAEALFFPSLSQISQHNLCYTNSTNEVEARLLHRYVTSSDGSLCSLGLCASRKRLRVRHAHVAQARVRDVTVGREGKMDIERCIERENVLTYMYTVCHIHCIQYIALIARAYVFYYSLADRVRAVCRLQERLRPLLESRSDPHRAACDDIPQRQARASAKYDE